MKLDIWDIKIIQLFKSLKWDMNQLVTLWAERCAIDFEYVKPSDILQHLAALCMQLNLINEHNFYQLIVDAQPESQWKFNKGKTELDPILNWITVLASLLRLTEVKKLPGYE